MNDPVPHDSSVKNEMSLLDILAVPLRYKRMIVIATAYMFVLSAIISFIVPVRYTATTLVLPPQESATGLAGLNLTNSTLSPILQNLQGQTSSADLYTGILSSRSAMDVVIEKLGLHKRFGEKSRSAIYRKLTDMTDVDVSSKTRIVSISVKYRDPKLASDIANAYVEALDQINQRVNVTEGKRKRMFLEKRIEKAAGDMQKAEGILRDFEQEHKLISITDQARASIENAAQIQSQIVSAEIELEVMKSFSTEKQTEARMLLAKISELKKQLGKIESGGQPDSNPQSEAVAAKNSDAFLSLQEIPSLSMKLGRLMREVKIQEGVFELLTSQYELSKIEEAGDINTVQVLDPATPPDKKSSPRRMMIVILSTLLTVLIGVCLSFVLEYTFHMKNSEPENYGRFMEAFMSWHKE